MSKVSSFIQNSVEVIGFELLIFRKSTCAACGLPLSNRIFCVIFMSDFNNFKENTFREPKKHMNVLSRRTETVCWLFYLLKKSLIFYAMLFQKLK